MFNDKDGMATINLRNDHIPLETLKKLFDFCFKNSDTISLSQASNVGMTKAEADSAIEAYNTYLKENGFTEGLYLTEEEKHAMYHNIAETEEELKAMIQRDKEERARYEAQYKPSSDAIAEYINDIFQGYHLIDRVVTCMTPSNFGGPQVLYYLKADQNLFNNFNNMKSLFDPVIKKDEKKLLLADPTFYNEGKILLMVHTHEKHASLFLEKEQYQEFAKLDIPHKVGYDFNVSF